MKKFTDILISISWHFASFPFFKRCGSTERWAQFDFFETFSIVQVVVFVSFQ